MTGKPKQAKPEKAKETKEEPKPVHAVSAVDHLVERVEKIMANETRVREIEAENKALVGMVARLYKEIGESRAKA